MVLFSIVIYFLFFIVSLGCACMYEMYTNVCKISFDHVPVCVAVQSYSYFVLSSSQPKKTKKTKKKTRRQIESFAGVRYSFIRAMNRTYSN